MLGKFLLRGQRNSECESAAAAFFALHPYLSAMGSHDAPGNGQAESRATAGAGLVHLVESLEDTRQMFGSNADTAVRYCKRDAVTLPYCRHGDMTAFRSELDGVVQQIVDNLTHHVTVRNYLRKVWRDIQLHSKVFGPGLIGQALDDFLYQRGQRGG